MFRSTGAATPTEYIDALDEPRRSDIAWLHQLIRREAPLLEPHIAAGMLAYGSYHYRYASGREGDWSPIMLASNKRYISLYLTATDVQGGYLAESYRDRLPRAIIGRSCVRFKRLADVDLGVIAELVRRGAAWSPQADQPPA